MDTIDYITVLSKPLIIFISYNKVFRVEYLCNSIEELSSLKESKNCYIVSCIVLYEIKVETVNQTNYIQTQLKTKQIK